MNKKTYIKPNIRVRALSTDATILAASGIQSNINDLEGVSIDRTGTQSPSAKSSLFGDDFWDDEE